MKSNVLVDAGPLIAILNAGDADHGACVEALKEIRPPLLTVWPPVVEAMYLLAFAPDAQEALLDMIERGVIRILSLDPGDVAGVRAIMQRYRDRTIDFADAALVHVAEREKLRFVFTLDRRDFSVYRVGRGRGRSLRILPS